MIQNITTAVNLTRIVVFSVLCNLVCNTSAQCWDINEVKRGFKANTGFTLDSLTVCDKFLPILDHSIKLSDTFHVNHRKAWFYFVVGLNSYYDSLGQTNVRIELRQGVDYDILKLYPPFFGDSFSGAFCYKGFTFFVLCEHENLPIYKELFSPYIKKDFYVYYNKTYGKKIYKYRNYRYLESFSFLFYKYKEGDLKYLSTKFME